MEKKFDSVKDFYSDLHGANKTYQTPGPYCISLVRTKCILGLLLVATFYRKGKPVRHLECSAKEWPYMTEMHKEYMSEEEFKKHEEELARRRMPSYTFSNVDLTLPAHDQQRNWYEVAEVVTQDQFIRLLQELPDMGWIDLDWESWGK